MKIFEVLDSYYPKLDGPNNVITFYAENLNLLDDVTAEVFVPAEKNFVDAQKFVVHRVKSVPAVAGYNLALSTIDRKLKKYLKSTKVDLIHVHSPFPLGRFFLKYGKKNNIPTVFTFHTAYKDDFDRILPRKWQRNFMMNYIMKTINLADEVLTVSNGAAGVLKSYGFQKPIGIIRNGTDFSYPKNAQKLVKKVNQKHGLANDEVVFLSTGRLVENKRLDVVLDALKILKQNGQSFKYFISGDGPYKSALEKKVKLFGLENNVCFLGSFPNRSDLVPYYLRANLFLFPSTFDTASLAPLEAAALKLPTMMTEGAPTAEIVVDGQNGFCAGFAAKDWAQKLQKVLENPEKLLQMKSVCHKEVYRPWRDVVDEVYQKYRLIIKNYKKPAKKH